MKVRQALSSEKRFLSPRRKSNLQPNLVKDILASWYWIFWEERPKVWSTQFPVLLAHVYEKRSSIHLLIFPLPDLIHKVLTTQVMSRQIFLPF